MEDEYPPTFVRADVDGVKVVKDEVLSSGLSQYMGRLIPIRGIRVLTLEDGDVVHGCADCEFCGTLGQVRQHRSAEHGMQIGGHRGRKAGDAAPADPVTLPRNALSMTLHEVLGLAAHVDDWETVLSRLQEQLAEAYEQRDEARNRARLAERKLAEIRRKAAKAFGLEVDS